MTDPTRTCAITGSSAGIGKAVAIEIAKMGWQVIMLVRESEKARMAFEEVRASSEDGEIQIFIVDLSSRDSIIHAVDQMKSDGIRIDVLVNNAGVVKRSYETSTDGHEMTLAVNHLGPFLLTNLLLPLMNDGPDSRIVNVTSEHYRKGRIDHDRITREPFKGTRAYADSKLAMILFTRELSRRLHTRNITVNSMHPGIAGTDVFREYPQFIARMINLLVPGPASAARSVVHLVTSPELENVTGAYFTKSDRKQVISTAEDDELARIVWDLSEKMTGLTELL
ncbi:SDR family NAD(P)-dependent oxidoreductase [Candidatus Zixiibacteriota bacterium]